MKIEKLEDVLPNGAVTEVEKRFKEWFDNAKADGLQYVSITLNEEVEAFFKDPLNPPSADYDLQKVLEGFLAGEEAIERGDCEELYFGDGKYHDDVERHDASELFNKAYDNKVF